MVFIGVIQDFDVQKDIFLSVDDSAIYVQAISRKIFQVRIYAEDGHKIDHYLFLMVVGSPDFLNSSMDKIDHKKPERLIDGSNELVKNYCSSY